MQIRVLFFIESLEGGGAEKVLETLVRHIDKKKYDLTVIAISGGGKYEKSIASHAKYSCLLRHPSCYRGIKKIFYALKYKLIYSWLPNWLIYRLFIPKGFDVEVAFVEGFATKLLAASCNKHAKRIAWVHCDLKVQPWTMSAGVYRSRNEEAHVYGKYDAVVCVSRNVDSVMKELYGLSNTMTIYNPIDERDIKNLALQKCEWGVDGSQFNIISVGRLEKVKGYDKLIPIIKNVRNKGVDVHLWIVGNGTQKGVLENLVKRVNLEGCVTFTGFMKNPYSLMSKMDLFVCSSRAEGFSLVIGEAMILGIPVISMNCAGPRELISMCNAGVLCGSYDEMEREIIKGYHEKTQVLYDLTSFDITQIISQVEKMMCKE